LLCGEEESWLVVMAHGRVDEQVVGTGLLIVSLVPSRFLLKSMIKNPSTIAEKTAYHKTITTF